MGITIREFKFSAADYAVLANLRTRIWPEHPTSAEDLRLDDKLYENSHYVLRRFMVEQNGETVGYGVFFHMPWLYDPQRFFINGGVLEQYRGRGIGQALYDHILRCMREAYDGNELHTWTTESRPFSIRFLEKRGFVEKMRNWESRLDTANFDFSRYAGVAAKVAANGVQIKTLTELLEEDPDAMRKLYELEWVLSQDVPAAREPTKVPFEDWIERHSEKHKGFIPEGNFIAVAADGDYVGVSTLWRSLGSDMLYIGLTGVKREWRRKGIARALKVRAIRLAKDMGDRVICTWNEQNNPMYLLNLELGFVTQPAEILYINELE